MVELKFYQPEELVRKYLNMWHVQDDKTVIYMQQLAQPHFSSLKDLLSFLKNYVLSQVPSFVQSQTMSKEQTLALIQFIYIHEKLYNQINLFDPQQPKSALIEQLWKHQQKYALPLVSKTRMLSQPINLYNPFRKGYDLISKVMRYVFKQK